MKRLGKLLLCAALAAMLCAPSAMAAGDSEAELRALLDSACGGGETAEFYWDDYDGDGECEAFAFVGESDEFGYQGDLWFVSADGARMLMSGTAYDYFELRGAPPAMAFLAEEGNGGHRSQSHIWAVSGSQPVAIEYDSEETGATVAEFYEDVVAQDASADGSGQTRKPYYFFRKDGEKREYGGIYIGEAELYEFRYAREAVQELLDEGYRITDIVYRSNHIIHVNFSDGTHNRYLTLRYNDSEISYSGEGDGIYELASDPAIAVYPAEFVHPSGTDSATSGEDKLPEQGAGDVYTCRFDLDGDGAQELLALRRRKGTAGQGYDTLEVTLDVSSADGAPIASGCIFSHYGVEASQTQGKAIELKLYALGEMRIYTEGTSNLGDAASTAYRLVEPEDGALVTRVELRDPGYSEGYVLERGLFGDLAFECWDNAAGVSVLVDPLEEAFAPYALRFAPQDRRARAQLDERQLICSVNALELPEAGQASRTGETQEEEQGGGKTVTEKEISGTAHATGDVNLRDKANLDGNSIAVVPAGAELEYLGETRKDTRGVAWYRVRYGDVVGWGSSKYVVRD